MKTLLQKLFIGIWIILGATPVLGQRADETFDTLVSETGKIRVPDDYRKEMVFLGAWGVKGGGEEKISEFHNVYTTQDVVTHFQKTGEFLDGAVIIKEVAGARSGSKTTGDVSWTGAIKGWFVMVKDTQGRFPENPLWGNGWGWSFFNADNPTQTISTDFQVDCLACHQPAKETDWIYLEGYPALNERD